MTKKVISFSLWGRDKFYSVGAIRNAELAPKIYPGWETYFYVNDVDDEVKEKLQSLGSVVIETNQKSIGTLGMFWRFFAIDDPDVSVMISRDTDSRISVREKIAVDEWLDTKKTLHVMRDHPYHNLPIMGGMWGIQKKEGLSLRDEAGNWLRDSNSLKKGVPKSTDQSFLQTLYHRFLSEKDYFCHDQFPFLNKGTGTNVRESENFREISTGFPSERSSKYDFVGIVYDENEIPCEDSSTHLESFERAFAITCSLPQYEIEKEISSMFGYGRYNSLLPKRLQR